MTAHMSQIWTLEVQSFEETPSVKSQAWRVDVTTTYHNDHVKIWSPGLNCFTPSSVNLRDGPLVPKFGAPCRQAQSFRRMSQSRKGPWRTDQPLNLGFCECEL